MNAKPWKEYQQLYQLLVTEHPDDFSNMEIVEEDELVHNALKYFDQATFPLIYPAKSYAVAIIYAYKIKEVYGVPVLTTLDDPDLFLGQDPYFVPYSADKETYADIIAHLQDRPNFLQEGWAPQTVKYFEMECTEEGLERLQEEMLHG
jgi:hypothetical protein